MIDQMTSLAMSMHANPGVYALLLGSGISRAAQIPTGWDIVNDLVRKIAVIEGGDCGDDPCSWYEAEFGHTPSYSKLLKAVGRSRAERSQLLRGYFEPNEDELEDGVKRPTAAHRAIAKLVSRGFVRVILTTNFDQLMEQALDEVGVSPTLIATPSALSGAQPLVHSKCTVIKLHGDYMDLETRNTPVELESYDPKMKRRLDTILDEFGLIIAGWSGDWDTALREAIQRRKSRRYTIWWSSRGELTGIAKGVCEFCQGEHVSIVDADRFFIDLNEKVEALESIDSNHPISAKIAVSQTKKYLSESKFKIRLHDMLMGEIDNIIQATSAEKMPLAGQHPDAAYVDRIRSLDSCTDIPAQIMATGCYWDREGLHLDIWSKAISRLLVRNQVNGASMWMQFLGKEPARLLLYSAGVAFAANSQWDCIFKVLSGITYYSPYRDETSLAHFFQDDTYEPKVYNRLPNFEKHKVPISEHTHNVLRHVFTDLVPIESEYSNAFDTFEILQSLWFFEVKGSLIPSRYMWRESHRVLAEIVRDVKAHGVDSKLLKAGFFGGDMIKYENAVKLVGEYVGRISSPFYRI
jgi:hypothetical protein